MSSRGLLQLSAQEPVWEVPPVTEQYIVGMLPDVAAHDSDSDSQLKFDWLKRPANMRKPHEGSPPVS